MMIRCTATLLISCFVVVSAAAKDANVGPTMLALPPPTGYCELDAARATDARAVKAVEGMLVGNRLLAFSADCAQLADWRTGKRELLDNIAQYQTLIAWENGPLPAAAETTIKQVCGQLRAKATSC